MWDHMPDVFTNCVSAINENSVVCGLFSDLSYMAYIFTFGFFIPVFINVWANLGIVLKIREVSQTSDPSLRSFPISNYLLYLLCSNSAIVCFIL